MGGKKLLFFIIQFRIASAVDGRHRKLSFLNWLISSFCSAEVNPAPVPLHLRSVPYPRTPTGQGVDILVSGGGIGLPKKGTVSAKADTPLSRHPIIPPETAPLGYWLYLLTCGGFAPTPLASFGNCRVASPSV